MSGAGERSHETQYVYVNIDVIYELKILKQFLQTETILIGLNKPVTKCRNAYHTTNNMSNILDLDNG